jgi:hypothetical protein
MGEKEMGERRNEGEREREEEEESWKRVFGGKTG